MRKSLYRFGHMAWSTDKTANAIGHALQQEELAMRLSRSSEGIVLLRRIARLWMLYIKGQLLMSLIIGLLTFLVGLAIGLPYAFALGLLAGILETVPNIGIGSLIALVPAVGVALWQGSGFIPVQNWVFALIVVGAYGVVQQVGALVIHPRMVGKWLDLPAIVVFLAVILGAAVGNLVGAYLAVPLLVTGREVARYGIRKVQKLPPFPEETPPDALAPPPGAPHTTDFPPPAEGPWWEVPRAAAQARRAAFPRGTVAAF
jgi:predicted PurR-regulated permease PerM